MELNFSKKCKPKSYSTKPSRGDVVRYGSVHFCGRPSSYVRMHERSRPMTPLPPADCHGGVARDPDSFRPSMLRLKRTRVYPALFVYDRHDRLKHVQLKEGDKYRTYFYAPTT